MNFCWVTLPVKNLEASLTFYHGILGLPISSRHEGAGMKMAMLGEEAQPKIELVELADNKEKHLHSDLSIGIAIDSMESAMELLETKKILIERGPNSPNPSIRFFYVLDPDGYEVQLVETRE